MVDILIRNAEVLHLEDEKASISSAHDILVLGNRIAAIQPLPA